MYTNWAKSNPSKRLTLSDMQKIEAQAMKNAGIPSNYADNWAKQSIDNLKASGITDADITNIPWNGKNR